MAALTPARVPVLDASGKLVGDVAAHATSVGASKLLGGASPVFRKHPQHGWVWQAHGYANTAPACGTPRHPAGCSCHHDGARGL